MGRSMKTLIALSGVLFTIGCGSGGSSTDDPGNPGGGSGSAPPATASGGGTTAPSSTDKALVRVVHASADAPKVDVYAKGVPTPILSGVSYGDCSTWLPLDPGTYTIELRVAPSKPSDPAVYTSAPLDVAAGTHTTAIAAGLVGSKDSGDTFRILRVDENFAPAGAGTAAVRIVHASPDAPSVGVDVGNDDPTRPEIASLARFADTGADGVPLPSGQPLQIGIDAGGQAVTSFTVPALPERGDVLVIATGLLSRLPRETRGFALLAIGPEGAIGFVKQNPSIYALHASPDAPAVDAFVGDTQILDNLSFGQLAAPVQVPPGSYTLDFYAHLDGSARPASEPAASRTIKDLAAGERYLAIADGFLAPMTASDPAFRVDAWIDAFALDQPQSAVTRAVHASPDAPAVDFGVVVNGALSPVLFKDLKFGGASDGAGLAVAPTKLRLGATPTGYPTSVVASFDLAETASTRTFTVAAGVLDPHRGQTFRLLLVDTAASPWKVTAVHPVH